MNKKLIVFVLLALSLLSACGKEIERNGDHNYISDSKKECSEILFTCKQFEKIFSDSSGCGCEEASEDEQLDANARSLKTLVRSYLGQKLFPSKEEVGYEIIIDYLNLNSIEELIEDSKSSNLTYEIWAVIEKYEVVEDKIFLSAKYVGPMVLDIEQTGLSYIIWGHKTFDVLDEETISANFSEVSTDWILDQSDSPSEDIKAEMQKRVSSEADALAGLAELINNYDKQ